MDSNEKSKPMSVNHTHADVTNVDDTFQNDEGMANLPPQYNASNIREPLYTGQRPSHALFSAESGDRHQLKSHQYPPTVESSIPDTSSQTAAGALFTPRLPNSMLPKSQPVVHHAPPSAPHLQQKPRPLPGRTGPTGSFLSQTNIQTSNETQRFSSHPSNQITSVSLQNTRTSTTPQEERRVIPSVAHSVPVQISNTAAAGNRAPVGGQSIGKAATSIGNRSLPITQTSGNNPLVGMGTRPIATGQSAATGFRGDASNDSIENGVGEGQPSAPSSNPSSRMVSNQPSAPQQGGMRELRVEDALVYLDDVKRQFGDKPRIYNEFLEIMKNFKSQEVDTPGVINQVSKLFRGYNNLILGFNKFLPDGYKISLADLEQRDMEYARQQDQGSQLQRPGAQTNTFARSWGSNQAPTTGAQSHMISQQQPSNREGTDKNPSSGSLPSQVPSQVFTKRLPQSQVGAQDGQPMVRPGTKLQSQHVAAQIPNQIQTQSTPQQQQAHRAPIMNLSQLPRAIPMQASQQNPSQPPKQQQPQHQGVEFDHAISYVTNIKKRFADDPNTYHQFLEILHTYQKEQRGIKEVLEQVASLFSDHPDLLKEFTFFLPDTVQGQAKERLNRAAADSEARQALNAQQGVEPQQGLTASKPNWGGPRGLESRQVPPGRRVVTSQKFIDMTGGQQVEITNNEVSVETAVPSHSTSLKRPQSPLNREVIHPRPEIVVYNSAVEKQFFEAVREALNTYSRDGGQAWLEFQKCLDFYAQEELSKSDMLSFVEPIFGKRHAELFEELKRILTAAGSPSGPATYMEDSWYSVPLSEIDFLRCRQCSPSYRALPRDYPAPPCGGRSDEEKKVLNGVWVSLPKGSEESYTFRHMRRNHCEEVLFRCEDERFEIDMVIDSNAATLRRLEPIAEEIAQLGRKERLASITLLSEGKLDSENLGMAGLRFQYSFDPNILGVIHRNVIARIYGDSGQEMLELIVKNPTVAVPIVVERLRQKDKEWKLVRERLNRHWKELAEANYYKSLDHRSLTWRIVDKKTTSTRTILSEIKDRAVNNGREGDAVIAARREKAKEEHGSFYSVTMGDSMTKDLNLTDLPKPYSTIFTPHLSFLYKNNTWAQRDAYRILLFALERGTSSPTDKERYHRLWRDFLGPIFGISVNWMQSPALRYQQSSNCNGVSDSLPTVVRSGVNGDYGENDDDDMGLGPGISNGRVNQKKMEIMDHHPLPAGTIVSTSFGKGRIVRFLQSDNCYCVELSFGIGYLQPPTVLCSLDTLDSSVYTNELRDHDESRLDRPDDLLIYGTQSLYLFFRLHQILIHRLNVAKKMAYQVGKDTSLATLIEQFVVQPNEDIGRKRYDAFLSLVYTLMDGQHCDSGVKYEDRVRCLLGHGGYELATMDKLLSHLLKNLQTIVHDDVMLNLISLFQRHNEYGFRPEAFRQEAAYLSEGENMYAFQLCRVPDSDDKVIYMEYLGVIYEDEEPSHSTLEAEPEPVSKRQRVKA